MGLIPGLGKSHMLHGSWAHVPQLLSPCTLQPVLSSKRSHCDEKPVHCRRSPQQIEKACAQQQKPSTAQNKQINKNYEKTPTNPCQIIFLKNTYMGDLAMAASRQRWKMAGSLGRQPWIWEGPKTKVLWNFTTRNQAALTIKQVVAISWSEVKIAQLRLILCDPMDRSHQTPLSMEFSRQEYWSGLPCPSPGIFLIQGSNPGLPLCRQIFYYLSYSGNHTKLPL